MTMTPTQEPLADLVGRTEIADRLGVRPDTVKGWRATGELPQPRWTVSGTPIWDWNLDIVPWAETTGRADGNRGRGRPRRQP